MQPLHASNNYDGQLTEQPASTHGSKPSCSNGSSRV